MQKELLNQADKYKKEHKKSWRRNKLVTALAAAVVFCTTYGMILPALTWDSTLICELPEHQHDGSCYETVTVPAGMELICDTEEHAHGPECYEQVLICEEKESEGHAHGDQCFNEDGEQVCGLEEWEGHSHSDGCYELELVCAKEEHEHTDECYEAVEEHEETILTCGLAEHTHSDACFDAVPAAEPAEEPAEEAAGPVGPERIASDAGDEKERVIRSEPASDGAVAVVKGLVPADAVVEIRTVELSDALLIEYFGEEKAASMSGHIAYDITIWVNGEEWQPDNTVSVVIRHPDIAIGEHETLELAHVDSLTNEVSAVESELDENGDISFSAAGFSLYIAYTVDFHYEDLTYSITGEGRIFLSELFRELKIDKRVSNVADVDFSNEELVRVERKGHDWLLTSLAPFDSMEQLTITFIDGSRLLIETTDARVGNYDYLVIALDVASSIPDVQEFEYTINYTGLDFTYDITTKQATVINSPVPVQVSKTITVAAGSSIPMYVQDGSSLLTVHETPIQDVDTYVQMGGNPMEKTHDARLENPTIWQYGASGAICYKHMNESSAGKITVSKEVTGDAPAGQTYRFSVVRHNGTYKWVEEIVELQAGQTSLEIPYTHTTEYEASPEIWIAELNAPSGTTQSFLVNGTAVSAEKRELHWRFNQDVCNYNSDKMRQYQDLKWIVFDTSESQSGVSVVCTNAFPTTCGLTVTKEVSGLTDNATQFPFELTVTDQSNNPVNLSGKTYPTGVSLKSGTVNVLTFKLKSGKSISINGLIPENSKVTLRETSHSNYDVSMKKGSTTQQGDSWQFVMDQNETVAVTNTAVDVGDITISKDVVGGTMTNAFPMQLTITDTSGTIDFTNGAFYGRATIPDGVTRTACSKNSVTFGFSLKDGESAAIRDLVPDGASVTVTETNTGGCAPVIRVGSSSADGASRTFTVSGTDGTNVAVENHVNTTASLVIGKTVTGAATSAVFPFELTVLNSDDTVPDLSAWTDRPSGIELKTGTTNVFCFSLGNSGSVAIEGILPVGAKLTLTETEHAGYTVSMYSNLMNTNGDSLSFVLNGDMTISVINSAGAELPSTGGMGVYPFYALGTLLIAFSAVYGFRMKRKHN